MIKLGKIRTLTIASLSAIALAAPIALAQTTTTNQENQQITPSEGRGHGKRHGKGKGWGDHGKRGHRGAGGAGTRGGMLRGITLTDDQKAKMKQISQSFRERTRPVPSTTVSRQRSGSTAGTGSTSQLVVGMASGSKDPVW